LKVVRKQGVDLKVILNGLKDKSAKVGFFESAKYEDGTPVAYVATIQEFGAPSQSIPARPFMRPAIKENEKAWSSIAESGARAVLRGAATINDVMEAIGGRAASDIQTSITQVKTPALKDSTIAARLRKRSDGKTVGNLTKPLVDSGLMLASVTHLVTDK
jgi:hypothetical protein